MAMDWHLLHFSALLQAIACVAVTGSPKGLAFCNSPACFGSHKCKASNPAQIHKVCAYLPAKYLSGALAVL